MPKRVDHEERRREIVEAVIRITLKGGLTAATFREVAAEAGVSVRLGPTDFGAKAPTLLASQRHVAERPLRRPHDRARAAAGAPPPWLRALTGPVLPAAD